MKKFLVLTLLFSSLFLVVDGDAICRDDPEIVCGKECYQLQCHSGGPSGVACYEFAGGSGCMSGQHCSCVGAAAF